MCLVLCVREGENPVYRLYTRWNERICVYTRPSLCALCRFPAVNWPWGLFYCIIADVQRWSVCYARLLILVLTLNVPVKVLCFTTVIRTIRNRSHSWDLTRGKSQAQNDDADLERKDRKRTIAWILSGDRNLIAQFVPYILMIYILDLIVYISLVNN